jgi:hypothetical protein
VLGDDALAVSRRAPAVANDGARLTKAVAVPKDKDSFRKSANTASSPFVENGADARSTIRVLGPSRISRVWVQRFDPDHRQGKGLVKKIVVALRRKT